jgi:hypothetical protein
MPFADDVRLGEGVTIFHPSLVNLYGCAIGDGTRIGATVEIGVMGSLPNIAAHGGADALVAVLVDSAVVQFPFRALSRASAVRVRCGSIPRAATGSRCNESGACASPSASVPRRRRHIGAASRSPRESLALGDAVRPAGAMDRAASARRGERLGEAGDRR